MREGDERGIFLWSENCQLMGTLSCKRQRVDFTDELTTRSAALWQDVIRTGGERTWKTHLWWDVWEDWRLIIAIRLYWL